MLAYIIYGVITLLLLVIIIIPVFQNENEIIKMRKRQTQNVSEENKLRYRFNELLSTRMKYSTREKFVLLFRQAGFNINISDFVGISILSSVLLALVVGFFFNNALIGCGFLIIGFVFPYQILMFLKNRRLTLLEKQIGSFLAIIVERFKTTKNIQESLVLTAREFEGRNPIYSELENVIRRMDAGYTIVGALDEFRLSTQNIFIELFLDSYKIAIEIGTDEAIEDNMSEVLKQFQENRRAKRLLKSRIATPKRDAMIMLMMIPGVVGYQLMTNGDYATFMTTTSTGKIGSSVLVFVFVGCFWFINSKIGAPID